MESCNVGSLAWVICSVVIATTLAASGQTNADVPQPINLEQISSFEHFLRSSLLIPPEVAFIDSDRLAVTFLSPCPELPVDRLPRLKDREEDNRPCGLTLTMLLVDTKTSQIQPTMSLPFHTVRQSQPSARSGFRLLLPTRRGEFLIHAGDFLLRYGPNLEPIEKRPISNPDRSIVYVSPDGRLALINEYEDVGKFRKFVFPSDDIQAGRLFGVGWPAEGVMNDGSLLSRIWDTGVWNAKPTDSRGGNGRTQKCVRQPGACVLLCASEANCQILGHLLSPVDDQKFAARIAGRRNIKRFAIVDRTGKVLYVGRASDPVVGFAVGAPAAQRLMIMGAQTRLSHGGALSRLAFDVLDLQTMEFVLKTTLQSSGIKHGGWTIMRRPDAAISPDGCKIAILVGSELRIYHLPAEHVDDVSDSKTRN